MTTLSDLRKEYILKSLNKKDVHSDPFQQFESWFLEAKASISGEPNAMIISTCGKNDRPSSRVVLLKGFSESGFLFFTNYNSRKGSELTENPYAALLFFWPELERQIRIEGVIGKISEKESSEYFASRPRLSQLGALASAQSQPVENRLVLENSFQILNKKYEGTDIPRPEQWGGFILRPDYFEYWQGRRNRLHDRISYRNEDQEWHIQRLSP